MCPECGSPDVTFLWWSSPEREPGPGEWAVYRCVDCGEVFNAIEPEPPDGYEGDGVFAENH